jgi:hypothetical protein
MEVVAMVSAFFTDLRNAISIYIMHATFGRKGQKQ